MKKIEIELRGNGHPRLYELLKEIGELHDRKNSDYATSSSPLSNFYEDGSILEHFNIFTKGLSPLKTVIKNMNKQYLALLRMIGENKPGQAESRKDKWKDIAVYALIGCILEEENENGKKYEVL